MANANSNATRVKIPCRISFCNLFEARSINGSDPKFSCSLIIDKDDKKTLLAIHNAVEAAKENGKSKWSGKIPGNLKLPLRDGDIDRPDDEAYQHSFFINANNKERPQLVDRKVQPITDPGELYSGCYCNVTVNFYAFNQAGNRGIGASLGNVQKVRDGEPLSGRVSAAAEFEALEDDEVNTEELPDYLK